MWPARPGRAAAISASFSAMEAVHGGAGLPSAGPPRAAARNFRRDHADGMTVSGHGARARWLLLRVSGSRRRSPRRDDADGMSVYGHGTPAHRRRRLDTTRAAGGLGNW